MSNPELGLIKGEIKNQENIIHDNFDKMMLRLSQVEEGISHSKKNLQRNMQMNSQSEESMNELIKQLQKIERDERLPQYHGNKDQLFQEIEEFENILEAETERIRYNEERGEMSKKTVMQPLQTF